MRRLFKQHWPEVPARIEVVSVFEQPEPSQLIKTYVGMLTYFYRNPNLHTGDYAVEFADSTRAQWWVQQFKNHRVNVRVNPRDPDDSVLLQLPLIHAREFRPEVVVVPASIQPSSVKAEPLSPGQRSLAEFSQLVSLAGLGATLVVLCLGVAAGPSAYAPELWWLGGALLAAMLVSLFTLSLRVTRKHSFRTLRRFYASWTPASARKLLTFTAPILGAAFLLAMDRMQVPAEARTRLGAHLPCFAGAWGFMASWAMHTAVLRSQHKPGDHAEDHLRTN